MSLDSQFKSPGLASAMDQGPCGEANGIPTLDVRTLSRKNIALLIVFDAVAELKSVSLAAERLSLSQPAVSHAVGRLRCMMNDRLFVGTPIGLVLTTRAEAMVGPARRILERAQDILLPAAGLADSTPVDAHAAD